MGGRGNFILLQYKISEVLAERNGLFRGVGVVMEDLCLHLGLKSPTHPLVGRWMLKVWHLLEHLPRDCSGHVLSLKDVAHLVLA